MATKSDADFPYEDGENLFSGKPSVHADQAAAFGESGEEFLVVLVDFGLVVQLLIDLLVVAATLDPADAILHRSVHIENQFRVGETAVEHHDSIGIEAYALVCERGEKVPVGDDDFAFLQMRNDAVFRVVDVIISVSSEQIGYC